MLVFLQLYMGRVVTRGTGRFRSMFNEGFLWDALGRFITYYCRCSGNPVDDRVMDKAWTLRRAAITKTYVCLRTVSGPT